MHGLIEVPSQLIDGQIRPELSDPDIADALMEQRQIVMLKHIMPPETLNAIRIAVHEWGKDMPVAPAGSALDENFHAFESGISPRQKTLHTYHAYNFNQIMRLPAALRDLLLSVFEPMRKFQNRISGENSGWDLDSSGKKLHPQVIHYPSGGGMFAAHVHPLLPQRLGLILSISQRGRDFTTGGAGFELPDGTLVDPAAHHDLSDMVMFRYDLRHWVSFVDQELALDRNAIRGRWVMVLPYY
ncbi:MAG: hypothetical protein JWL63_1438 [Rhodocyclales bacterium]|nr:hypothetical protein [Rhodocyclales bacterium]